MHRTVLAFTLLAAISPYAARASEPVTLSSLLAEMVDRDHLARLPAHPFRCLQASSYDRAQTDPKNLNTWFANHDSEQFIRTETNEGRKEWVIMEHAGPGAITRYWVPLHQPTDNQTIRFYFDGAKTPAITAKINDLFRGRLFIKSPFAFVASDEKTVEGVAGDLYLPIPFAKACKITLDSLPFYYNINYRAYDKGTEVKTFAMADYEAAAERMKQTTESLREARTMSFIKHMSVRRDDASIYAKMTVEPGNSLGIGLARGENAVRILEIQVDPHDIPQALRSAVLRARFDSEETAWCPLGEFFGCGVRMTAVDDWYRSVAADGTFICRWTMPYRESAHIDVLNCGKKAITVTMQAATSPWHWDDRSLHFHATWRHQYPIETKKATGTTDWNYLEATGQGVYVGDTLTVFSPSPAWYGEGDERVYVDGEKFPSHLGTGTEDYYGYAWGMARQFNSPFISMPRRDGARRDDWRGYTTTSRVRLLDEIPFQRSLKFDMEIWDWEATKLGYSAATFWYARPGATSNRQPMPEAAGSPIPELPQKGAGG
jgi:hypothetical protein